MSLHDKRMPNLRDKHVEQTEEKVENVEEKEKVVEIKKLRRLNK